MNASGDIDYKKVIRSQDSLDIQFRLVNRVGETVEPDTLVWYIFDVVQSCSWAPNTYCLGDNLRRPQVSSALINDQNGVDLMSFVADGAVSVTLYSEDTGIEVQNYVVANHHQRRVLFVWTWDGSPYKRNSLQVTFRIAPDRSTVAV